MGLTVKRLEKIVDYNDQKIPNGSFIVFYQNSKKKEIKAISKYRDMRIKPAAKIFWLFAFLKGALIASKLKDLLGFDFDFCFFISFSKIQIHLNSIRSRNYYFPIKLLINTKS